MLATTGLTWPEFRFLAWCQGVEDPDQYRDFCLIDSVYRIWSDTGANPAWSPAWSCHLPELDQIQTLEAAWQAVLQAPPGSEHRRNRVLKAYYLAGGRCDRALI